MITARVNLPDTTDLDSLLTAHPWLSRHALLRLAVAVGLEQLRKDAANVPKLLGQHYLRTRTPRLTQAPEAGADPRQTDIDSLL